MKLCIQVSKSSVELLGKLHCGSWIVKQLLMGKYKAAHAHWVEATVLFPYLSNQHCHWVPNTFD